MHADAGFVSFAEDTLLYADVSLLSMRHQDHLDDSQGTHTPKFSDAFPLQTLLIHPLQLSILHKQPSDRFLVPLGHAEMNSF